MPPGRVRSNDEAMGLDEAVVRLQRERIHPQAIVAGKKLATSRWSARWSARTTPRSSQIMKHSQTSRIAMVATETTKSTAQAIEDAPHELSQRHSSTNARARSRYATG
jgi:hypothetical protein